MSPCRRLRESCINFWKLVASLCCTEDSLDVADCEPANSHPTFVRVLPANYQAATDPGCAAAAGKAANNCGLLYGRLKHCDSRDSIGGPLYRYVSSLSLELRALGTASCLQPHCQTAANCSDLASCAAAAAAASAAGGGGGDTVASQLMEKLANRDLSGSISYCRLLLTLEPNNSNARDLLDALESEDRFQATYYVDDYLEVESMDATDTDSETQFRYFHHDQHGQNEDERSSRRSSSESDHFLDASSSSSD